MFIAMPFGLSSVGFIFTKILRELLKYWRRCYIDVFLFLDDGFSCSSDFDSTLRSSIQIKSDLIDAGWVPHSSKSQWFPVQRIGWIGFIFDFVLGMIFISDEKIVRIISKAEIIKKNNFVNARFLAGWVGLVNSIYPAVGDIVYLQTKCTQYYISVATVCSWNVDVEINQDIVRELQFWIDNAAILNGVQFYYNPGASSILMSDASGTGAAVILEDRLMNIERISHCEWDEFQCLQSSTYREMYAIWFGLCQFNSLLLNQVLDWFTDSANTVSIVKRGSMNQLLQGLALKKFSICSHSNIKLRVIWLPRDKIDRADFFSRIIDSDDWEVEPYWFNYITSIFGKPSIDRFADACNTRLPRFNSRFYSPFSEGVDAFAYNWGHEYNYLVPPLYLVPRVKNYLCLCHAKGILIVPHWPSAYFWPCIGRLLDDDIAVINVLWLGNIFRRGRNKKSLFGSPFWSGGSIAILIDFS